jgi:hypothetical protein
MVKRLRLVFILFLFSLLIQAQTTYFVAPFPTGNDVTGVGTEASPWASLYKASTEATETGDVIHVKPGTYTEAQRIVLAEGLSMITGENQYTTIINCTFNATSSSNGAIYAVSSSVTNTNQTICYLTITGSNYTAPRGIYTRYRNNFSVHHCIIKDFDKSGINAYSEIDWVTPPAVFTTGLRIYNNTIENCSEAPCTGNECNLRWSGHSDYEIYNNTFTNTTRLAQDNIYSSQVKNGSVHDNIFNTYSTSYGMYIFAMEIWNNRGGNDIYNNTLYGAGTIDVGGHTIQKGIYAYGTRVRNNTITLPALVPYNAYPTVGITIECWVSIESVYVYGNHVTNFPWGISVTVGQAGATIEDIHIYSNVVENSASSNTSWASFGIGIIQQSASLTRRNINIINNTVTGNQTYSYRGIYVSVDGTNDGIKIKNNIIQDFDMGIKVENNSGTIDSLHLVNNLINDCGTTVSLDAGVSRTNYVNSGQSTSDPLFVSATNFHLQDGSPAAGTGVYIGSPYLYDYDGTPFLDPPPRGAFEVTSEYSIPTLTTTTISGITDTSAVSGGVVSSDGGASVTARGVCWSTSSNPTITNSHTTDGTGTGTFTSSITGLTATREYFVRAYATNAGGTAYGNQRSFFAEDGKGETINGISIMHNGNLVKVGITLINHEE